MARLNLSELLRKTAIRGPLRGCCGVQGAPVPRTGTMEGLRESVCPSQKEGFPGHLLQLHSLMTEKLLGLPEPLLPHL